MVVADSLASQLAFGSYRSSCSESAIFRNLYHEGLTTGLDDKRRTTLTKWVDLNLLHPHESRLGQLLRACLGQPDSESEITRLVEDWFAKKSTSTAVEG